ncbi:M15 family metallopeptidase [Streptomyces sp. NPDC051214]|uniref:M15 family metallopeptidase n=1 Tax=Streptomyces sp. NPDC051214 TaxID=3155282 RepID=UPI00341A4770
MRRRLAVGLLGLLGLAVVIAAITAALGGRLLKPSSSSAASPLHSLGSDRDRDRDRDRDGDRHRDALGEEDGVVPDGVTVFDDTTPAVTGLDPELLKALRRAATEASYDGVKVYVNSGWRSADYQNQLLREAVAEHGSEDEAARWVATAATSPHVSGDAADLGHSEATKWLTEHGAEYGLCQIYKNEPWHYELRPEAVDHGCPRTYADPTEDPRMQQ